MPIKSSTIRTGILSPESQEGYFMVQVLYTDELIDSSLFDLAYSSAIGGVLPYLFVGYFTDGQEFHKWFFSNARRHEEMREAIEGDIGTGYNYTYGQLVFSDSHLRDGELLFNQLVLHSELPDKKVAEKLLRSVIRPENFRGDFYIGQARF